MKKYIKKESSQSIAFDRCCLNGKNNDLAVQGEAYFSFKNMKNIISYNIEKFEGTVRCSFRSLLE